MSKASISSSLASPFYHLVANMMMTTMTTRMATTMATWVCFLFISMDIAAGILGILAQRAQNKMPYEKVLIVECWEPSYKAYGLGFAACVLLGAAHVFANMLCGCFCFGSKAELGRASPTRQLATASQVFSWITGCIAFILLVIGTVSNAKTTKTCGLSRRHVLVVGGIMSFVHGLFLVAYYVAASAVADEDRRMIRQQMGVGPYRPPVMPAAPLPLSV
ncbi:unnamed protein product [Cuscuta campestris]|uniref:Uncharacterized protein n=1 Tax=Cuscuta campestris TaxID=132261 RepID=A0A484MJF3_9ASTE|nr:unnamed protein product [Cuscuta campestris]